MGTRRPDQVGGDEYVDPISSDENVVEYAGFTGLRNNTSPEMFSLHDLLVAENIDINDSLDIHRRRGYSSVVTAAVTRDLWSNGTLCLGVGSNALKQVNPDWSTVTLRSGLMANRSVSYDIMGDRVFYSNGVETGCVQNGASRSWGLEVPGKPVLSAAAGDLRIGKYQVVVTYLRQDGQESGAGLAVGIELTDNGGIALSSIPVSSDPTVPYKAIYATSVDGQTLYRVGIIPNADTTFAIRETQSGSAPLLTQHLSPAPAGQIVAAWKGWMLVAVGSYLYVSEPFAPELFDLRKSFPHGERITMIAPFSEKSDGVWIGTENHIYWNEGESPSKWDSKLVADYGVLPGTLAWADGELMGDGRDAGEPSAFFGTTRGLCYVQTAGKFINLTQSRFAYPMQDRGAGIVRRHGGMIQYLATMQGAERSGNTFF